MLKSFWRSILPKMSSPAQPLRPIVAVIGTTGVGKSQLAVSLAQSLGSPSSSASTSSTPKPNNAVILSADSMQLYKGLDVITNKVTEEERGGVEHWGLDLVQPGAGASWELGKWCTEAGKKVDETPLSTLPIVCGGTHYFIQHFLFPPAELSFDRPAKRSAPEDGQQVDDPLATRWTPPCPRPSVPDGMDPELKTLLDTFWTPNAVYPTPPPTEEENQDQAETSAAATARKSRPVANDRHELLSIWRVLEAVDPNEAGRWHWRDGRKVRRGLERWWERGGGAVKKEVEEGQPDGGVATKFRTLIFWVYESVETLRPRLDKRVDKMVANGLLQEIEELRGIALKMYGTADAIDHAEGIFQTIGYKEFSALPLPMGERNSQFESMLARTKLSTHQYAKSQVKWIKKQLLPTVRAAKASGGEVFVYVVPGGASGEPLAREVLDSFLAGKELPDPSKVGHPDAGVLLQSLEMQDAVLPDTADRQMLNSRRVCEICSTPTDPFSVRIQEWDDHLTSKIHKRNSKFTNISREEWIAAERAKGLARKAEREKLKAEKVASEPEAEVGSP